MKTTNLGYDIGTSDWFRLCMMNGVIRVKTCDLRDFETDNAKVYVENFDIGDEDYYIMAFFN